MATGIGDALRALEQRMDDSEKADSLAVGVWCDRTENPGILAVVRNGKLETLAIASRYRDRLDRRVLKDAVEAVVLNAFVAFKEDRNRIRAEMKV